MQFKAAAVCPRTKDDDGVRRGFIGRRGRGEKKKRNTAIISLKCRQTRKRRYNNNNNIFGRVRVILKRRPRDTPKHPGHADTRDIFIAFRNRRRAAIDILNTLRVGISQRYTRTFTEQPIAFRFARNYRCRRRTAYSYNKET